MKGKNYLIIIIILAVIVIFLLVYFVFLRTKDLAAEKVQVQTQVDELIADYPVLNKSECNLKDFGTKFIVECKPAFLGSGVSDVEIEGNKITICRHDFCNTYDYPTTYIRKSEELVLVSEGPIFHFYRSAVGPFWEDTIENVVMTKQEEEKFWEMSEDRCNRYENERVRETCFSCLTEPSIC